jgi:hypothetical protein
MPFDEEAVRYVEALDARADVELLRRELPSLREECLRTLELSTVLLKRCVAVGLSLAEIGSVMSRQHVGLEEEPSELEKICMHAREAVERCVRCLERGAGHKLLEGEIHCILCPCMSTRDPVFA